MKAKLILQTGEVFEGESFGYEANTNGETVFNTWMVGYPETLTDPSYKWQILVCTYPLQGNYGVPNFEEKDSFGIRKYFESNQIHISALIVSEYSQNYHHCDAQISFGAFLKSQKIPAITWIDTRLLTQIIREKGCILGKIIMEGQKDTLKFEDPNKRYLSYEVGTKKVEQYGTWKKKICLVDMGVKHNMLRNFLKHDVTIIRVPWDHPFMDGSIDFDGLFISNGPWDPALYTKTISELKKALDADKHIFGICLWNQLLWLAMGAKTYKLKYGHRWQNQPVKDLKTGKCILTSQNHSFAINEKTLPKNVIPWMRNINDGTNEGIYVKGKNAWSVQFHPESSPGPNDSTYLFEDFIKSL
jgi:carbamoyl-phosphate synthase small subunit